MNIITYAVPFFIILILAELIADKLRHRDYYRLNDALTSIATGIISTTSKFVVTGMGALAYAFTLEQLAVSQLPNNLWWVWLSAFVLYDLSYYWAHRMGHEVNLLWAAHSVHHHSEDYNLTTALRQTSTSFLFSWVFYIPMLVLGFPMEVFFTVGALNLLYQFWVHTQHIERLGWMEKIFVTPSNHRVHHATNEYYLDRNYGGVFILWDRLFNSFQSELADRPIRYGTSMPLNSWNPLWANVQWYKDMALDAWRTQRWQDKLSIWFRPTGWRPADVSESYPRQKQHPSKKFDTKLSPKTKLYCLTQFVLIIAATFYFMLNAPGYSYPTAFLGCCGIWLSLFCIGRVLEQDNLAWWWEGGRLALLSSAAIVLTSS